MINVHFADRHKIYTCSEEFLKVKFGHMVSFLKITQQGLVVFLTGVCFQAKAADICSVKSFNVEGEISPSKRLVNGIGRSYFILPRQFGGKKLKDLTETLPKLKAMGVDSLTLAPLAPQTKANNHGYWAERFDGIDPELGTWEDFLSLNKTANKLGMILVIDLVSAIAGPNDFFDWRYAKEQNQLIDLGRVSSKHPTYFRNRDIFSEDDPYAKVGKNIYHEIEYHRVLEAQNVLSQLHMFPDDPDLMVFRHTFFRKNDSGEEVEIVNEPVLNLIFYSYKRFFDIPNYPVRHIRVDAAKNLPMLFQIALIEKIAEYFESKVHLPLVAVMEYIQNTNHSLDTIAAHLLERVHPNAELYFYDFPKANAIRNWVNAQDAGANYEFHELITKWSHSPYRGRYLPVVENHDFLTRFTTRHQSLLAHMMSAFYNGQLPIIYQGGEVGGGGLGLWKEDRPSVEDIDEDGRVGRLLKIIGDEFDSLNINPDDYKYSFVYTRGDSRFFLAKVESAGTEIYLLVNDSSFSVDFNSKEYLENQQKPLIGITDDRLVSGFDIAGFLNEGKIPAFSAVLFTKDPSQ